jgi:hypothetical protein
MHQSLNDIVLGEEQAGMNPQPCTQQASAPPLSHTLACLVRRPLTMPWPLTHLSWALGLPFLHPLSSRKVFAAARCVLELEA